MVVLPKAGRGAADRGTWDVKEAGPVPGELMRIPLMIGVMRKGVMRKEVMGLLNGYWEWFK